MKFLAIPLLAILTACGGGLSSESKTDIQHAARDTAAAYEHEDAAAPAGALIRAAHCAVQGVIRNEKLDAVDSGITCPDPQ